MFTLARTAGQRKHPRVKLEETTDPTRPFMLRAVCSCTVPEISMPKDAAFHYRRRQELPFGRGQPRRMTWHLRICLATCQFYTRKARSGNCSHDLEYRAPEFDGQWQRPGHEADLVIQSDYIGSGIIRDAACHSDNALSPKTSFLLPRVTGYPAWSLFFS